MNFTKEVFNKIIMMSRSIEATDIEWSSSSYFTTSTSIEFDYYDVRVKNQWRIGISPQKVEFTTKRRSSTYERGVLVLMEGLELSCNRFTGRIPEEIGGSQDIRALNLSHNELTGHIPWSFSALTNIESIDLSYNNLAGSLADDLTGLNFLVVFNVFFNNLSCGIPHKNQFQ